MIETHYINGFNQGGFLKYQLDNEVMLRNNLSNYYRMRLWGGLLYLGVF